MIGKTVMDPNHPQKYSYIYIENFHRFQKGIRFPLRQFTVIVGPNGSGKSALSKAIELFCITYYSLFNDTNELRKKKINKFDFEALSSKIGGKDYFIIRWEMTHEINWPYIEFTYFNRNGLLELVTTELGFLDKKRNKIKICKFSLADSETYIAINKFDDLLEEKDISLRDYVKLDLGYYDSLEGIDYIEKKSNDEPENLITSNLNEILSLGSIDFLSEKYLREFSIQKGYGFDYDLVKILLFKEQNILFDNWEVQISPNKNKLIKKDDKNSKRKKRWLDLLVEHKGLDYFLGLSNDIFLNSFIVSSLLHQQILEIFWGESIYHKIYFTKASEDIRKIPPKYFIISKKTFKNDYFGLFSYLYSKNKISGQKIDTQNDFILNELISTLQKFQIADDIYIEKVGERYPDTQYYQIFIEYKGIKFDLNHLSSGGKQLLPILFSLFRHIEKISDSIEIFFIRQPELHLHPKLQMEFPEVLIKSNHFEIQLGSFDKRNMTVRREGESIVITIDRGPEREMYYQKFYIIETHSEHIVRKFQLLVAKENQRILSNKDIGILYIQPKKNSIESTIKIMELDEKGNFIDEWPGGFFDEASELAYALLEAQVKRKN